jgi:hypothetical protein
VRRPRPPRGCRPIGKKKRLQQYEEHPVGLGQGTVTAFSCVNDEFLGVGITVATFDCDSEDFEYRNRNV